MIALQREELYLHPSEEPDEIGRAVMFLSPPTSLQNPHSFFIFFLKIYLIPNKEPWNNKPLYICKGEEQCGCRKQLGAYTSPNVILIHIKRREMMCF